MVDWKVRAIRGATTVSENSSEAIRDAVCELLDVIEANNACPPEDIVSVTFSVTPDLDAIFPAAIARQRPRWENVPLLDVQQMYVKGSLERCIRVLIHVNSQSPQSEMYHAYLRQARSLRPDWHLARF
ncbi:chorismate mutase [Synechocystis salina LEGE 06155]|uniref:chorismate mutase n=1 Tax=Synechocystis salina LEGE 00031 TaxID=1828736 RepID=A0ABR9VSM7_9SYNC|nr:chorismate mutase [Synechocystis salina]MBD2652340.1 chorismate mutase [Synechocystis sp. FACHB-383]MBE9175702.1 chorismate mutase [Synechocystis salina LEGE 06155]MBE9194084.1 chorismate mutase [Synechocystis sp. LEGE 06083]MBE9241829.1 chorismate mutase [Synechocystis salina LEGE 00041]MBE9253251.1 chorismate mutase [Synechocystis salina LEGE 00031]WLT39202.1 chorismate mutase [Synechocystis sp. B12]